MGLMKLPEKRDVLHPDMNHQRKIWDLCRDRREIQMQINKAAGSCQFVTTCLNIDVHNWIAKHCTECIRGTR